MKPVDDFYHSQFVDNLWPLSRLMSSFNLIHRPSPRVELRRSTS